MSTNIYKGQNLISTIVLLSVIGVPVGIYIYGTSGLGTVLGWVLIAIGIMVYIFLLIIASMKLPEKHRKAVEGKTFLDMEIYRNKEESDSFLFGVAAHETLTTSDVEAQAIEQDSNFIEIKQSCILESEKALLEYELERRETKELVHEANIETVEDTVETEPEAAHDQIIAMQKDTLDKITRYIKEEREKIDIDLKKMGETVDSLKLKIDSLSSDQEEILKHSTHLDKMTPDYKPSDKNMTRMTVGELQFRITSLENCEQIMARLSDDDALHALQYRVFQVRRIFKELFSEDVQLELIKNYQPASYFNTGVDFERFALIMRRPYADEFTPKSMGVNHEDYPVTVQCAKCAAVTAGWANSQIPIFLVIFSPADAFKKIDIVHEAKALQGIKEKILMSLVTLYKTEFEQSDYALEEERALTNTFIVKYDELKQKLEEIDWQPEVPASVEKERIVKVIPSSIKTYSFIATLLWVIFLVTTIFASIK